ncbi:hypothetical protein BST97_09060 [Nonlabens spongiae]|uniref:DUF1569 domain-containing protein n=1 Tax=Nonlabens spongiae TaxID=331648 RepID=A0A1W6MP78_9FLAO|nr:DUF1569 domain-containing protein [Nonlabens spongiae]ARN79423.1 hypothetical protein BST97_09060 [Nonlabens spongiae]
MPSFFDQKTYDSLRNRLDALSPDAEPQWGRMDAAQMLKHCQYPIQIALEKEKMKLKPNYMARIFFKKAMYNDKPWKKNLPTVRSFKVVDQKDFESEREKLDQWMQELWYDRENENRRPHPVFGKFTNEQWGQMQWKHLDHHFRQFGV